MKKICILSMQRINNYGSVLQSYSLKKILGQLGADVHFIDIEKRSKDDNLVSNNRLEFKNESSGTNLLSKLKKIDKFFFYRLNQKKLFKQQIDLFDDFRENELNIKLEDNYLDYDLCVIGSDEVFNCMSNSSWGFTTQLFGNVSQSKKVITYAASCGATTIEDLNDSVKNAIKSAFDNISGFSARDNNTKMFITQLSDLEVNMNLDPVWVGNFEDEIQNAKVIPNLPLNYCIIYSYPNRISSKRDIKNILDFCKKNKLEPIAIGGYQAWVKKSIICNPFEMLKIFKNAAFIITDTFHGTIFSQKFNGKYAVLIRDSNRNKLTDLVERINAKEHVIENFSELDKTFNVPHDSDLVSKQIENDYKDTINYLKKHIQ